MELPGCRISAPECPHRTPTTKKTKRANSDGQGANICFSRLLHLGWKALALLPGNISSLTRN